MEAATPLLSIVIPVKDDFDGVSVSLQAITALRDALEIIVVDGTDDNGAAINEYFSSAPNPWNRLITGARAGVYDAMNQGAETATGTHVVFCGAGDKMDSEVLSAWLASQEGQSAAPQLHAFAVNMGKDREGGVPAVRRPHWNWRLNWQNTLHHQGLILPREWVLSEPFDTRFRVLADYHWALKMRLARRPMQLHPDVLTECAGAGLSRQFNRSLYLEEWAVKREVLPVWVLVGHLVWLPAKWAFKRLLNPAS